MDGSDFLVALALTCVAWWAIRAWLIAQMSNVSEAGKAGDYLSRQTVNITAKSDTYLYTDRTSRPKSKK